jgi:hypothetical protein
LAVESHPIRVGALCDWIPDVAAAQRQASHYLEQLAAQELRAFCQL